MIGGMPLDSHLLALFFVTSVVAMAGAPGRRAYLKGLRGRRAARRRLNVTVGSLFIGLGVRLAAER
jgi:threonine/homoserine/homoserine lactone efflux protein